MSSEAERADQHDGHLAAQANEPTWQPIETAPKDTAVLVYHAGFSVAHFNTTLSRWIGYDFESSSFRQFPPTHWMPLPAPPGGLVDHLQGEKK